MRNSVSNTRSINTATIARVANRLANSVCGIGSARSGSGASQKIQATNAIHNSRINSPNAIKRRCVIRRMTFSSQPG